MPDKKESSMEARFWAKVDVRKDDECWEWQAGRTGAGYGQFCFGSRVLYAHRTSWEIHQALVPDGLCVCHTCDNPPCVNPAHLWIGTRADNQADMAKKGRGRNAGSRGEDHGRAKLTDKQVLEIRSLRNRIDQREIAAMYGIGASNVSMIQLRRTWKHL